MQIGNAKNQTKQIKQKYDPPPLILSSLLYYPFYYALLHTVNDLATQRTITNYDPRRRLRTTLSGPTKLSAAHSNQNLNGYVMADSSSSCPTIPQ